MDEDVIGWLDEPQKHTCELRYVLEDRGLMFLIWLSQFACQVIIVFYAVHDKIIR